MPALWRRWTLLCCVLLFAVFSSAQAVHIHGDLRARQQVHVDSQGVSSSDSDEAHCPFCSAAHSVLPTADPMVVGQVATLEAIVILPSDWPPVDTWHYARFSRPPPIPLQA